MAEIISFMASARERGEDGLKVGRIAYPSVPEAILAEAWWEAEEAAVEKWWQSVEKTIDGEIIRNALGKDQP